MCSLYVNFKFDLTCTCALVFRTLPVREQCPLTFWESSLSQALGWVPGTDTLHLCLSDSREPAHQCGQDTQGSLWGWRGAGMSCHFCKQWWHIFLLWSTFGITSPPPPPIPGRSTAELAKPESACLWVILRSSQNGNSKTRVDRTKAAIMLPKLSGSVLSGWHREHCAQKRNALKRRACPPSPPAARPLPHGTLSSSPSALSFYIWFILSVDDRSSSADVTDLSLESSSKINCLFKEKFMISLLHLSPQEAWSLRGVSQKLSLLPACLSISSTAWDIF